MTNFGAGSTVSMMPAVNDVIDDLHRSLGLPESDFFCECGHADCSARIALTRAEYASLKEAAQPVLVPRHSHRGPGVFAPLPERRLAIRASQQGGDPGGR